jgi:DHA1 family bicyclomycin/chloramphenicol resistance-like MFS transporter
MSGFAMAGMFGYITSSSFVFINTFKLSVNQYSILFGVNAAMFVSAAQINARIVGRVKHKTLIAVPIVLIVIFSIAMLIGTLVNQNIYTVAAPLIGYMICIGFIVPNSIALAMAPFSSNAGSASALLGTLQFSMAAISAIIIGHIKTAPLISMSVVMSICAIGAASAFFGLLAVKST